MLGAFGRSYRRPLVLMRAMMLELARASSRKILVAPCCCARMTADEALDLVASSARQVALDWLGAEGLIQDLPPQAGGEDFAFMLEEKPGCYLIMGNGEGEHAGAHGCMVHNAGYDFNDACLPVGASYWVKLTEAYLDV